MTLKLSGRASDAAMARLSRGMCRGLGRDTDEGEMGALVWMPTQSLAGREITLLPGQGTPTSSCPDPGWEENEYRGYAPGQVASATWVSFASGAKLTATRSPPVGAWEVRYNGALSSASTPTRPVEAAYLEDFLEAVDPVSIKVESRMDSDLPGVNARLGYLLAGGDAGAKRLVALLSPPPRTARSWSARPWPCAPTGAREGTSSARRKPGGG